MPNELQVPHGRLGVELLEHAVRALACGEGGHAAVRIVKIAEHDRLRRAGLLACGLDRPVGQRLPQTARFYLVLFDPLHTERTLLHDAARADHDVRVEDEVLKPILVRVVEPVEPPHFVRAVVAAVPGADAPVVRLLVQPFVTVRGGKHRADRFTRRVRAVLA